jgi:transposase
MLELDNITILKLRQMQRNEKDKRRHVKITIVLMLAGGISPEDIAYTFDIDVSTIYRYAEKFRASNGIDEYLADNYTVYEGKLSADQLTQLEVELQRTLYTSAKEACAFIQKRFSVSYTPEGLVPLLKRLGFVYKKTRQVPAKADPEAQTAFLEKLEVLIEEAETGAAALYYVDATHPQHNTRASYGWIKSGEDFTVRSTPGRHRLNINGAVNALKPAMIEVRADDRIDAASTIALLKQIQRRDRSPKIYVVCDGARYYHSRAVTDWLDGSRIELVQLPGYSPNLNLIERLWKFMHQKVIDPIYYPTKEAFREAVLGFFDGIKQHKAALESLLTLNFRVLGNSQTA